MAAINNSEFLLIVFGNAPEGALPWVAGFKEDPLKVDGRRWDGLPVGWNTKAKYIERLGAPFVHQLEEWYPDRHSEPPFYIPLTYR